MNRHLQQRWMPFWLQLPVSSALSRAGGWAWGDAEARGGSRSLARHCTGTECTRWSCRREGGSLGKASTELGIGWRGWLSAQQICHTFLHVGTPSLAKNIGLEQGWCKNRCSVEAGKSGRKTNMKGWSLKASGLRAHQLNNPVLAHKTKGLLNQAGCIFHEPTTHLTLSLPTVPPRPSLHHKPDSVLALVLSPWFSAMYLLSHLGEIQALQLASEFIQKAWLLLLSGLELGLLLIDQVFHFLPRLRRQLHGAVGINSGGIDPLLCLQGHLEILGDTVQGSCTNQRELMRTLLRNPN